MPPPGRPVSEARKAGKAAEQKDEGVQKAEDTGEVRPKVEVEGNGN